MGITHSMQPGRSGRGRTLAFYAQIASIGAWLLVWAAAAHADTWWNESWRFRSRITLDTGPTGANITESIGRVPVLVRLHAGNFNFKDAKPDGADLRFVAGDEKTLLNFHIESFDAAAEQAMVWVDVPGVEPGGKTVVFAYYGAEDAKSASAPTATYDDQQILIYHFAGQGAPSDATRHENHAQSLANTTKNSLIGYGLQLDGKAAVTLPMNPSLTFAVGEPVTISMWVKPAQERSNGVVFDAPGLVSVGMKDGKPFVVSAIGMDRSTNVRDFAKGVVSGKEIPAESWAHIAVRIADRVELFVNGERIGDAAASAIGSNGPAQIGIPAAGGTQAFVGLLDELQISAAARATGAIQLAARSQGADARLIAFAPAEQQGKAGQGYLAILLHAVTPDGWVVIALLAAMAVVSWWVMLGKAFYVRNVETANDAFMDHYRRMLAGTVREAATEVKASDAAASDVRASTHKPVAPTWTNAPLQRLYEIGMDELNTAPPGPRGIAGPLSAEAIALVRSSLDAGLVREGRRLNRLMVLLTISISGGPFLGLLGTVIGVMITFAAIAAAGDVNINSIAPGIAAALVATVAGLAVAIPALFGYNYLTSRIEEITSEMQIFVDEFEKRVAARRGIAAAA